MEEAIVYLYDNKCEFYPVTEKLKKQLTVWTNVRINANESTRRPEPCYYIEVINGKPHGVTHQGFWKLIMDSYFEDGIVFEVVNRRIARTEMGFPEPDLDKMYGFRFSQEELITSALVKNRSGLIGAPTRFGKCLCVDTEVLMYDGTLKKVQDVHEGDKLMGPDGKERTVVALGSGIEPTYKITPNKGESFYCNESHILSLKATGGAKMGGYKKGDIINISVKDYLSKSKTFKHITKLWYAPLDYNEKSLPFDPWMVGVWLGDGCISGNPYITKPDLNVQQGIIQWAESVGMPWRYHSSNTENDTIIVARKEKNRFNKNPLIELARYCTDKEKGTKYIPTIYLTASRKQRLELLAGLIDTDGYNTRNMGYEIVTKYETLAKSIIRLCRSLGFRVTRTYVQKGIKSTGFKGWYWRLQISGKLEDIPCRGHKKISYTVCRVDPTLTGFTVEQVPARKYYGFELKEPDKLFLLWDNLVTHNTSLMVNTIRAYPTLTICVVAPGVDLVNQMYEDITVKFGIKNRTTHIVHGSKKLKKQVQKGDIVVCSIDSLPNIDPDEFDLLIADEPHAFATARRVEFLERFHKARRLGFGATLHGRSDGRDKFIMGLFGPILAKRTYLEAVREGAICPLEVIFYDVELAPSSWKRRDTAYNKHFYKNETIANTIKRICHEVIPADMQTLIFIKNEEQARMLQNTIGKDTCLAMAKTMTDSEREEKTALLKNNIIKRCLCTRIYVQGVTFSDVRFLVNAEAGGATTSSIQKPGRLAEIRPNKKCGIIIDLFFKPIPGENLSDHQGEGWVSLCRESNSRKNMYKREGYNITHVSSIQELKQVVNNKL